MDDIHEYLYCDGCQNREFTRTYTFSIRFHGINFSEELIYDRVNEEIYQCVKCNKRFSIDQIEEGLSVIRSKHKRKD